MHQEQIDDVKNNSSPEALKLFSGSAITTMTVEINDHRKDFSICSCNSSNSGVDNWPLIYHVQREPYGLTTEHRSKARIVST